MNSASTESEQPKYKRMALVLTLALLAWVGGWIAAGLSHAAKTDSVIIACTAGGFMFLIFIVVSLTLLSQAKLNDLLRAGGFVTQKVTSSFWKGQIASLPPDIDNLFRTAAGVGSTGRVFSAALRSDERGEVWFIRHVIQQGKTSTIRNGLITTAPGHWPRVAIHRKGIVDSLRKLFGGKTVPLEDPKFNETVSVMSNDPEFAMLLMGPALQEIALTLKLGDELIVGAGAICVITYFTMTTNNWTRAMTLFESVQAAIPPELSEWQPAANTRASAH